MIKKLTVLMVLVSLSLTLGLMSHTYSRYIADATSDIKIQFSKWEIKINNNDITNGSISTMNLTPVMEGNNHVASNVVAPSSKGYFDIVVDPSNVEVSFNYLSHAFKNVHIPAGKKQGKEMQNPQNLRKFRRNTGKINKK